MKKYSDTIVGKNTEGNITIRNLKDLIKDSKNKEVLANFFYDRYYNRFLKSFDFDNNDYTDNYKNGFAVMTSCCILIETFVSFTEPTFIKTGGKSSRCFGYFFLTYPAFNIFSEGGLTVNDYKNLDLNMDDNNDGTPRDFYENVRCGLLHNGETRNKWKIRRNGNLLFDKNSKTINAFKFMKELKCILYNFRKELISADFEDPIWHTFKERLKLITENS